MNKLRSGCLIAACLIGAASAQAADWVHLEALGSGVAVNPSFLGYEVGGAILFQPRQDLPWFVGPRTQFYWEADSGFTRLGLYSGVETSFWLVNAVGFGLAGDVSAPTVENTLPVSAHLRVEPFLGLRIVRLGSVGALGVRLGFPYDFQYLWGFRAGVTLQFSGS